MSTTSSQPPTHDTTDNPLAKFSDVRAKPPAWLWPNWLPLGKLAILDGDPGLGKSTLLFDLAARVSSSGVMPDGVQGASGNVIILNAEDDPAETIQSRLAAAGANPERVFHLGEGRHGIKPGVASDGEGYPAEEKVGSGRVRAPRSNYDVFTSFFRPSVTVPRGRSTPKLRSRARKR
jgi:hypothetical protein